MEAREIKFHEITLADREWMNARLAEDNRNACEYTFANNYIWRDVYQVEVTEVYGCLVIRFSENGKYCYSYPVGDGDKKAAITLLMELCKQNGEKLTMSPLLEKDREQLLEWFPRQFIIEPDRDSFDYIYSREKLVSLAGKKLHGKRNHIARFKDGGDWSYEPMTDDNLEECRTMTYTWIKMRSEKWNEEMEQEVMVLHEAFDHMEELGLVGGVLRREGEIVAFSMGERLNDDTIVVHFEKAFPEMQGAYPMINQQFVINACEGYDYVNREEDTGDLGLRKAKLSYYPEILLKKYVATESDVVYAEPERDKEQITQIWERCFGDDKEYISFYLENRMTEANMLVACEDGKIVSMASFLPVQYMCEGAYIDARYVYAVATLPEYRGKGLARRILQFAREHYGQPLILAPAEESLMNYYEALGFVKAFPDTKKRVENDLTALECKTDEMELDMETISAKEYLRLRDERCERDGYVRWDEEALSYAMDLCAHFGGRTVAIKIADEEDARKEILMYEAEGDTLTIVETSLDEEILSELLPALMLETQTSKVEYGQLAGMIWMPDAMRDVCVGQQGYLALTLG